MNGQRSLPVPLSIPAGTTPPPQAGGPAQGPEQPRAELWLSALAAPPGPDDLAAIGLALGQLFGGQGPAALAPEELEWRFSGRWWLSPGR